MQIPALQTYEDLQLIDRRRIGNFFRSSLWQRQSLDFFWVPSERDITSRGSLPVRLPLRKLPLGAILVGRYLWPVHEREFLAAFLETTKSAHSELEPLCS